MVGGAAPLECVCFRGEQGLALPLNTGSRMGFQGNVGEHGSLEHLTGSPVLCRGWSSWAGWDCLFSSSSGCSALYACQHFWGSRCPREPGLG